MAQNDRGWLLSFARLQVRSACTLRSCCSEWQLALSPCVAGRLGGGLTCIFASHSSFRLGLFGWEGVAGVRISGEGGASDTQGWPSSNLRWSGP